MKLLLMRHAQAEEAKNISDLYRELTVTGVKEAEIAAEFLQKFQIDKILVSYATRTMQTAEIIQKQIKCAKFEVCPELYASTSEKIIEIIYEQEAQDKNILIIAHNPGIFKAALELVEPDSPEFDKIMEEGMPTAKIIVLNFPDLHNWQNISFYYNK